MIFETTHILGLIAVGWSMAAGDVVERRGDEPAITGTVHTIGDDGVKIQSDSDELHFVPWDRVRSVQMNPSDPALQRWREKSDTLWRARSRLERGDTSLAEPLFERLYEEYEGKTHETALVVAEGLLRCRLTRGANDLAVIPALETIRIRRAGVTTRSYLELPPVIDESTGLCPHLPPVWVDRAGLGALQRELARYSPHGDETVASIVSLYGAAVSRHLGSDLDFEQPSSLDHPGVEFLNLLIESNSTDAGRRDSARNRLTRQLDSYSLWAQAWSRYHIGTSLLKESGVGRHHSALVQLAHVPAEFSDQQPYLAGAAVALMSDELEKLDDPEAANRLRDELQRLWPNHSSNTQRGRISNNDRDSG